MSLSLLPIVPLAGAALVWALRSRPRAAGRAAVLVLVGTTVLAGWLAWSPGDTATLLWREGMGMHLGLRGLGRVMAVLIPSIAAPVAAFALAGDGEEGAPRLLVWILAFVGAMELLIAATDFLTLLVGWELVGACSWGLIGYHWKEGERPAAALRAFLTTRFGDLGLYLAAAAAFGATGSLDFAALSSASGVGLGVVAGGVLLAASAKSAQLPFSPWLFSAMSGPTPASALLHSATMVAAGAYALVQLAPFLEPVAWFMPAVVGIGVATTLAGGLVAAVHDDLKKALAASTSSQYGLMFVAVGVGSVAGASIHLVTHAAFKSLLFLGAGVAIHAVGTGRMDRMRLGSALPRTAVFVATGILALAAVPPLGGAYSKEAILAAAVHASPLVGAGILLSGVLTAFYAGRILLLAFGPGGRRVRMVPRPSETAALAFLAGLTAVLGLLWLPGVSAAAARLLPGRGFVEAQPWEMPVSFALIAGTAVACAVLDRRHLLFSVGLSEPPRAALGAWLGLPSAAQRGLVQPALRLARGLARFDDRVVDGGVRAAASVGRAGSRFLARWGEWGADGWVEGLARNAFRGAGHSRTLDDRGIDAAVEGVARGTWIAGGRLRALQTGLTHHYYAVVAVGLLVLVGLAVLWR